MFVKARRKKLAIIRTDFKLHGRSVWLMTEYQTKTKQELLDFWTERDDIDLVERYKLEFELVESKRIDKKPRHQNNLYLASIREADFTSSTALSDFWHKIQSKWEDRNLNKKDIDKFIAAIENFVPKS